MKTSSALAYVGHNSKGNRVKNDFYPTPPEATQSLLDRENFNGNIWECACGDGSMSKVMIDKGYEVYSSDLIDRGYGETGIDFLKSDKKFDNIITNPPFNLSTEFTIRALKQANNQVAMLNKLSFLEGLKRKELVFFQKKLKKIWIFSRRIKFGGNGLMAFAWFIFDKNYNGLPEVDWI
mgnify:CR=1 FL=1|tara:strand:+ start:19 stop:555 length:537 start_codon:yes stop_codon:yes gene_type:complete